MATIFSRGPWLPRSASSAPKLLLWLAPLCAALFLAAAPARAESDDATLVKRLQDDGCLRPKGATPTSAEIAAAKAECPDQTPKLVIETGMHTNAIQSIAVDDACTVAVTGSNDKTVRMWSLPGGKLVRTYRPPIGDGNGGRIDAVALSPDGRWIVAGGWDAHGGGDGLYVYARDGSASRRIGAFGNAVKSLAFSPDGRRLAAGLGRDAGVSVLDFATGAEIILLKGSADSVYGLAWAKDGTLYTASDDGQLRAYGSDWKEKPSLKTGAHPFHLAISPDQSRLAIAFSPEKRLDIFAIPGLKKLATADTDGASSELSTLVWLNDDTLVGGGSATNGDRQEILRRWNRDGRKLGVDGPVSSNTVTDLRRCGASVAFSTYDPKWGLFGQSGAVSFSVESAAIQMHREWLNTLAIAADGRQVDFALDNVGAQPVTFDVATASLRPLAAASPNLTRAQVDGKITHWHHYVDPKIDGRAIALDNFETSRSLAIAHDGKRFYLGTDFWLRAFDANGAEVATKKAIGGAVWAVDLTADDRILIAATQGGLIRWLRASDLTELLTLFVDRRDKRWVAWTPSGYYMASPGGEDLIGWNINRGWSQEAEFYPASAFHDRFYRPDIVQKVLDTLDEKQAIAAAETERANSVAALLPAPGPHSRAPLPAPSAAPTAEALPDSQEAAAKVVAENLPPQAVITSPGDGERFGDDPLTISYRVSAGSRGTIDSLTLEVDKKRATALTRLRDGQEAAFVLADPPKHDIVVSLTAASGALVGPPAKVRLVYAGAAAAPIKPNLHVIAIGVDVYDDDKELPRTYADEDIRALTTALKRQEGHFFGKVDVVQLLDSDANIDKLRDAFDALESQENDYILLYLVGHGMIDMSDDSFRFLTRKATLKKIFSTSLSERDLLDPLKDLPGRKLVFFESCHSGAAAPAAIVSKFNMSTVSDNLIKRAQITFFGAAEGLEEAWTEPQFENRGAFTEAVIEGLEGAAAGKDGYVTVNSLRNYLKDYVPALTNQQQTPVLLQTDPDNFPLAMKVN